jgi:hypothetical protein
MEPKTITITVDEFEDLENDSLFLNCLKECGVDNWNGYADAWELYQEMEEAEEG